MHDIFENGRKLPLVEDFYSIQGEGFNSGRAAYFIRVGGCDIGCDWCDAKFTWNRDLHPLVETDDIISRAVSFPAGSVVVTGGEPLLYPLDYLCERLKENGVETFIETSGTGDLSGVWDWICLSPKKGTYPGTDILRAASELKIIVCDPSDFDWAEENAGKVNSSCLLYLQPEWSRYKKVIADCVEYIKENPQWRISLQSHKYMNIP